MITVKIELWRGGNPADVEEIGRMYIANDGRRSDLDRSRGDYHVAVCRRGSTAVPRELFGPDAHESIGPKAARAGAVQDYPRLAYNVWRLISRALRSAFPEEK